MTGTSAAVGQQVVHERRRERVAVLVVGEVLEEHAADALHGAARDLALDDVRVDHRAAVLAHDVAQQLHAAGGHVDLARAHVGGVHPDRRRRRRCSARSPRARPGRRAAARTARSTRARRSRANEMPIAGVPRTLARLSASSMSSTAASSLCAAIARMRSRRIAAVSRTAPAVIDPLRLPAVPAPKPVTAVSPWIVLTSSMFDAERVGGELHDRGLDAVPGRAAGDVDVDRARRLDADRRRLGARRSRSRASTARRSWTSRRPGSGRPCAASACSARNAS